MSKNTVIMMKKNLIRSGCHDMWNSFMVRGAEFTEHDIPYCPTTAITVPSAIITWTEAKTLYKKALRHKEQKFQFPEFVCFYEDDQKFDGEKGIWNDYKYALRVIHHFTGVITPDFSIYQDFPEPIKLYATYRMRAFGYWLSTQGIKVINNVRWGTAETFWYCFDGIEKHSLVAIGTVGGSPWRLENRERFEIGLSVMTDVLSPQTIIVYGSANYPCFKMLREKGISIIPYPGKTASAFKRRQAR